MYIICFLNKTIKYTGVKGECIKLEKATNSIDIFYPYKTETNLIDVMFNV